MGGTHPDGWKSQPGGHGRGWLGGTVQKVPRWAGLSGEGIGKGTGQDGRAVCTPQRLAGPENGEEPLRCAVEHYTQGDLPGWTSPGAPPLCTPQWSLVSLREGVDQFNSPFWTWDSDALWASILLTLGPEIDQILGKPSTPEPQCAHLHKGSVEGWMWLVVFLLVQAFSSCLMLVREGYLPVLVG